MKTTSVLSAIALALAVQGAVIPQQAANEIAARQDVGSVMNSILGSLTGNKANGNNNGEGAGANAGDDSANSNSAGDDSANGYVVIDFVR